MFYKIGTPVVALSNNVHYLAEEDVVGVIIDFDQDAEFPYRIIFNDDDDDWWHDRQLAVTEMVEKFNEILNEP